MERTRKDAVRSIFFKCSGCLFVNGRMDGEWKCYDLYGTHIANQIFKNGIPVKTKRLNKK